MNVLECLDFESKIKEILREKMEESSLKSFLFSARKRLSEIGLPSKKDEIFHYFPLLQLYKTKFEDVFEEEHSTRGLSFTKSFSTPCLLFEEGRFQKDKSSLEGLPKEVVILPLKEAMSSYGFFLSNRLRKSQERESNPFALLNLAASEEGIFIYIPPKIQVEKPLVFQNEQSFSSMGYPKIFLFLGKEASLRYLFQSHLRGDHSLMMNTFMDLSLEEGAFCERTHVNFFQSPNHFIFDSIRANLKKDSCFTSFSLTNGSKSSFEDIDVSLEGENAEAILKGLWMLESSNQAHTRVTTKHMAPYTRSHQHFKGLNAHSSRSGFEGKIWVDSVAQKTEAYQLSNHLLLGKKAVANARPNLEIFADDVKASHGSTTSKLKEEELFYLQTRGLSSQDAAYFLAKGFCREILDQIPDSSLKNEGESLLQKILRSHDFSKNT